MKYIIASVRDAKSEAFGRPYFVQTLGLAIRAFDDEVNRKAEDNILHSHPEDFSLFALGKFDDGDGSFELETPKLLVNANEVIKKKLSVL